MKLFILSVLFLSTLGASADEADQTLAIDPPQIHPQATREKVPSSDPLKKQHKYDMAISLGEPYPSIIGLTIGYHLTQSWVLNFGFGAIDEDVGPTVSGGFRYVIDTGGQIQPDFGLHVSWGDNRNNRRAVFAYVNTGIRIKAPRFGFLSLGLNWGLTPRGNKYQTLPYLGIGTHF